MRDKPETTRKLGSHNSVTLAIGVLCFHAAKEPSDVAFQVHFLTGENNALIRKHVLLVCLAGIFLLVKSELRGGL